MSRMQFLRTAGIGVASIGLSGVVKAAAPFGNLNPADGYYDVYPSDNPDTDAQNVQLAVMGMEMIPNAPYYQPIPGFAGKVRLKAGRFNFGDEGTGRKTVTVTKGVKIIGEVVKDPSGRPVQWNTEVYGGGAVQYSLIFSTAFESGPFKVMNFGSLPPFPGIPAGDDNPVIFEGLRFTGWAGEAIYAEACKGLVITGCSIGDYGKPALITFDQPYAMIHSYLAAGPFCGGSISVTDNTAAFTSTSTNPADFPDDENFGACFLTNFASIDVSRNIFSGHDEGIEVLFNAASIPGLPVEPAQHARIAIRDNSIDVMHVVGEKWGGHVGIICCNNKNSDSVHISGNEVRTRGFGFAYIISGGNVAFNNNFGHLEPLDQAKFETHPFVGLGLGLNLSMPGMEWLGDFGDLYDSKISNNRFSGTGKLAIGTLDENLNVPMPPNTPPEQYPYRWNASHNNVAYGNNLTAFHPWAVHLMLAPFTYNNDFRGHFETAVDFGDMFPKPGLLPNRITGYDRALGGIGPDVSDSRRQLSGKMGNTILLLQKIGRD